MNNKTTAKPDSIEACVDLIIKATGRSLVVATPLGIGKANHLLNALWHKAKSDASLRLEIFTALSLEVPRGKALLEKKFLQAFTGRYFKGYPELDYIADIKRGDVPANLRVTEFYMQSGKYLGSALAQRWYTSSNYTHASRDIANRGVNVLAVMVGCNTGKNSGHATKYSLGSNPDLTVDLVRRMQRRRARALQEGKAPAPFIVVGMVNRNMPFMTGQAEVGEDFFDVLVDLPELEHPLFAAPRQPISLDDYLIGLYASTLVADGGTLQVGIGSLGEAFVYASELRHNDPARYKQVLQAIGLDRFAKTVEHACGGIAGLGKFEKGLYAATEMFAEGFMHLYKAGILKRRVYPDLSVQLLLNEGKISETVSIDTLDALHEARAVTKSLDQVEVDWLVEIGVFRQGVALQDNWLVAPGGERIANDLADSASRKSLGEHFLGNQLAGGAILHAAFFVGSNDFYQWLRELGDEERELFQMTGVGQINELYNGEPRDRAQRLKARFINTTIKVSLLGAACSDGLENNQVVSGVGGQYNFVAMAHALLNSRSILMLRAVRETAQGPVSNIVWQYPYETIPRHLRDIVISEYGIADLRSKSDEECVKAMLCIADSRFQQALMQEAKKHNKLDPAWQVPAEFSNNLPENLKTQLGPLQDDGLFPDYPYGCDFTEPELRLVKALAWLKDNTGTRAQRAKLMFSALGARPADADGPLLAMMQLEDAQGLPERINRQLLLLALDKTK